MKYNTTTENTITSIMAATEAHVDLEAEDDDFITLAARERMEACDGMLKGFAYYVIKRNQCQNRLDEIQIVLDSGFVRGISYDRVNAGHSSVPNRTDPERNILLWMDREEVATQERDYWQHRIDEAVAFLQTLSEDDLDIVIRYYDLGQNYTRIADEIYLHRTNVMRKLRKILRSYR